MDATTFQTLIQAMVSPSFPYEAWADPETLPAMDLAVLVPALIDYMLTSTDKPMLEMVEKTISRLRAAKEVEFIPVWIQGLMTFIREEGYLRPDVNHSGVELVVKHIIGRLEEPRKQYFNETEAREITAFALRYTQHVLDRARQLDQTGTSFDWYRYDPSLVTALSQYPLLTMEDHKVLLAAMHAFLLAYPFRIPGTIEREMAQAVIRMIARVEYGPNSSFGLIFEWVSLLGHAPSHSVTLNYGMASAHNMPSLFDPSLSHMDRMYWHNAINALRTLTHLAPDTPATANWRTLAKLERTLMDVERRFWTPPTE